LAGEPSLQANREKKKTLNPDTKKKKKQKEEKMRGRMGETDISSIAGSIWPCRSKLPEKKGRKIGNLITRGERRENF